MPTPTRAEMERVDDISTIELARILDTVEIVRHDCFLLVGYEDVSRHGPGLAGCERWGPPDRILRKGVNKMATPPLYFHKFTSVSDLRDRVALYRKLYDLAEDPQVEIRGIYTERSTGYSVWLTTSWANVEEIGIKYVTIKIHDEKNGIEFMVYTRVAPALDEGDRLIGNCEFRLSPKEV